MSEKGSAPTGLMIAAARGKDKTVLEIASAIEALLAA